eukprot:5481071-Amphidinium_carterae.1
MCSLTELPLSMLHSNGSWSQQVYMSRAGDRVCSDLKTFPYACELTLFDVFDVVGLACAPAFVQRYTIGYGT